MTRDHRFASLNGSCRRWLPDEQELEPVLDTDFGRSAEAEPLQDGWASTVPRRQPLARLGDVITIGARSR